jgi:hypothetical protein
VTIDGGDPAYTLDTSHVRPLATEDVPDAPGGMVAHAGAGLLAAGPDATGGMLPPISNATPPPLPGVRPPPLPLDTARVGGVTNGARTVEPRSEAPSDVGGVRRSTEPRPGRPSERRAAEGTSIFGRLGCGVLAAGGVAGAFAVVAAVAWVMLRGAPVVLTGAEADADAKKDWSLVAGTLGERGVAAEKACASPPYLAVEVVIAPDGAVRSAKLLNYPHEPTRACIERELQKAPFPRAGKDTVQVAVTLQK